MPTSVARWVSEAKTPRGGVFGEAKSSPQGAEGEGYAPPRGNYAAGRALGDNPEGMGEQVKTARCAVFAPRYPAKQGAREAIYDCDNERPCDRGGQTNPAPATKKEGHQIVSFFFSRCSSFVLFCRAFFSFCKERLNERKCEIKGFFWVFATANYSN